MSKSTTITIFGREDTAETRGSLGEKLDAMRYKVGEVTAEELKKRVATFLGEMKSIVQELPGKLGEFKLDEISISVEISASGKVSLLGSGAELQGKGGLTFTLKRE